MRDDFDCSSGKVIMIISCAVWLISNFGYTKMFAKQIWPLRVALSYILEQQDYY